MLESIQKYTIDTYNKAMKSEAANYARANPVLVSIIATVVLSAIAYGIYQYKYREVEDQTNNPPQRPIPPPNNPPPVNRKTLKEKIAIPFKLAELDTIEKQDLLDNASIISKNVQDLDAVLGNKKDKNYRNAVIIRLATKPGESTFNSHKTVAKEVLEEIIVFEKAIKPGDLQPKAVPDFIWGSCQSTSDKDFKDKAISVLYSSLGDRFLALEEADQEKLLKSCNKKTVARLFDKLKTDKNHAGYKKALEKALNLHFTGKMDSGVMPYVLKPVKGENGKSDDRKLPDDALEFIKTRKPSEIKAFGDSYPRKTLVKLITSQEFEYSDLPAGTTLAELLAHKKDVEDNIQNLDAYVKKTYASKDSEGKEMKYDPKKDTTAYALNLILAQDDTDRTNRLIFPAYYAYAEKALNAYCAHRQMKKDDDTYNWVTKLIGDSNREGRTAYLTQVLHNRNCLINWFENSQSQMQRKVYHACAKDLQKVLWPYTRDAKLDAITSKQFVYTDLPSDMTLDEVMEREDNVKANITDLDQYVKGTYADENSDTRAFTLYLLLEHDDDERTKRFWYCGTHFNNLEPTLGAYCQYRNMQLGDDTYKWVAALISDPTNEKEHTQLIANIMHKHDCLKPFYDSCTDNNLKEKILNSQNEDTQKILKNQIKIEDPD